MSCQRRTAPSPEEVIASPATSRFCDDSTIMQYESLTLIPSFLLQDVDLFKKIWGTGPLPPR